jgi:hypothetical protein
MADFGIEDSGDVAGVAGIGTGGNALAWENLPDWFFPAGVFGVGGPGAGHGVCGLGYSPTPIPAVPIDPTDAVGVYGQGGEGNASGVVGVGTGVRPGVLGIGDPNSVTASGTGVFGSGGLSAGIGVWGSGASEEETAQPPGGNPIGVFGAAGSGNSDGVYGIGSGSNSGVVGKGDPVNAAGGTGVSGFGGNGGGRGVNGFGYSPAPIPAVPPGVIGAAGVYGQGGAGDSFGVVGVGTGAFGGVAGIGDPNSNTANGTGMRGIGGLPAGVGVWGSGGRPLGAQPAPPPGNAVGVFGAGGAGDSDGVYGIGEGNGYGGQFASGFVPLRLVPATAGTGHPTGAQHNVGEFYVDSQGSLFYCKASGTPGTWVQLA